MATRIVMVGVKVYRRPPGPELTSDAGAIDTANWLQEMAGLTRNPELRRAAGLLLKPVAGAGVAPAGRRSLNDGRCLTEMAEMIQTGRARSVRGAALMIATAYFPAHQIGAVADRLRRKYRAAGDYFGTK